MCVCSINPYILVVNCNSKIKKKYRYTLVKSKIK